MWGKRESVLFLGGKSYPKYCNFAWSGLTDVYANHTIFSYMFDPSRY